MSIAATVSSAASAAVLAFMRRDAIVVTIARDVPTASGNTIDVLRIRVPGTGVERSYFLNAVTEVTTSAAGVSEQHLALTPMRAPAAPAASALPAEEAATA